MIIKPFTIFCDYDEVLVDLFRGMRNALGHRWDDSHWHASTEEKRAIIAKKEGFWENLTPTIDYGPLWSFIEPFNPCILTGLAPWDKRSIKGKWEWNLKYTQVPKERFFCVPREDKWQFATNPDGSKNLLIDDYKLNIKQWADAGGISVYHTSAASTIMKLKNLGFYSDEF